MIKSINKVIKILIFSDFLLLSAFGFTSPIFAIFITGQIRGGDVKVVGFAVGIYWLVKSFFEIPIGHYLDKNHGEKDDFYFAFFGNILAALVPIGYIFSFLPWHLYVLEAVCALGMAMAIPAWGGIFVRHIDKGKEAIEWAAHSTVLGFGVGITGIVGGILASKFGFTPLFLIVTILAIFSALAMLFIYKDMSLRTDIKVPRIPPTKEELL